MTIEEDPWADVVTLHGLAADEVRSTLQKCVRRGMLEEAILAAYELYQTGESAERLLWRRLEVMAAEDVGLGLQQAPLLIEALGRQAERLPRSGDRWIFAAHAVRLLTCAAKDRTSAELADWAQAVTDRGERLVEILDVAVDMHTRRGRALGRGRAHFFSEGNIVADEVSGRDTTWLDYLRSVASP
jgi:replication-associated recombination protein RarA